MSGCLSSDLPWLSDLWGVSWTTCDSPLPSDSIPTRHHRPFCHCDIAHSPMGPISVWFRLIILNTSFPHFCSSVAFRPFQGQVSLDVKAIQPRTLSSFLRHFSWALLMGGARGRCPVHRRDLGWEPAVLLPRPSSACWVTLSRWLPLDKLLHEQGFFAACESVSSPFVPWSCKCSYSRQISHDVYLKFYKRKS